MSSKSEKIVFCVRLPNEIFWRFNNAVRAIGETKASFFRRILIRELRKVEREERITKASYTA